MSRKYKKSSEVPDSVLINRLEEISDACTKGYKEIARTFVMRIPAEVDFDPDLVIGEAANRLKQFICFKETLRESILNAFMAGQAEEGVDPSYSSAVAYFNKHLYSHEENKDE